MAARSRASRLTTRDGGRPDPRTSGERGPHGSTRTTWSRSASTSSSTALTAGVAAHHAGMLPVFKETVEELFEAGLVKVVFATETLSLGINMPAQDRRDRGPVEVPGRAARDPHARASTRS